MSILFFSDLHGNYEAWECVKRAAAEPDVTHVFCLGDLIDRGKNSCRIVIEFAELMRREPGKWFFILGNHEQMLQVYLLSILRLLPRIPTRLTYYWDTWIKNGGDSVYGELLRKTEETTPFLNAFVYIISNGYYKVLIQTPGALYNCSHAGPAVKIVHEEKYYGENSRRLWSRMDKDFVGVTPKNNTIRLDSPPLDIGPGEEAKMERHPVENKKFYIFGHTPTHEDIIIAEWENSYNTYIRAFLRIDAGLAYDWQQVAIGKIIPGSSHSVQTLRICEKTAKKYIPKDGDTLIAPNWGRIWEALHQKEQNLFKCIMMRSMTMSWIAGWAEIWEDSYPTEKMRFKDEAYYAHYDHLMEAPEFRVRTITGGTRRAIAGRIIDERKFGFSSFSPARSESPEGIGGGGGGGRRSPYSGPSSYSPSSGGGGGGSYDP